ncbi:Tll0287-like domain-containing protein [Shewanella frigidimarina]|uniref:Tll0287-like domain-containing protein n=1 Tax=Shewanella frigidimarina TaxID=56812 RepID=UPI003D7ADC93
MKLTSKHKKTVLNARNISALLVIAGMSSLCHAESLTQQQVLEQQANQRIAEFSQALKGQLQAAIKQGGLINAVSVCKSVAPAIAAENSKEGWTLTRTSLRVRNSDNTPDEWELSQLQQFELVNASGQQPADKPIVASEFIVNDGNTQFRYMKVIPAQQLCLGCHGSNIEPEVSALLSKTYPDDKAINFSLGDIRGAFSLKKVIETPASSVTAKP